MSACEPCWNEAYRQSRLVGGSQVDHYLRLLEILDGHPHDQPPEPPADHGDGSGAGGRSEGEGV